MAELELPDAQRRALGEAALAWVLEYFNASSAGPVYPTVGARELAALADEPLPKRPQAPARVLDEFAALAALGRKNGHPRMFGYVQSSGNFAGTIGDFLAAALNQNVTSWRSAPSATTIELQVIKWIKTLIGCEAFTGGLLLGGGSAANLAALAAALRASTSADINRHGVVMLPGRPVIYASERVHMSIAKGAALLGLGQEAVRMVPCAADGRIDLPALRSFISDDRAAGRHLVCVVANAGDVNTGAVDPIEALADLCEREGLWLHVDGAYGGFAAAVPSVASLFAGMSRADSVTLDPHKWLFAPLDAGCLLVRDETHLRRAFSHGASYIDVVADQEMSDFAFWDVSPELSRRFRALKLWFALKCHGADEFVSVIAGNIALAQELASLIDGTDDLERLAPVPLSIVCFRYVPREMVGDTAALNQFNRRLMVELQREGDVYLSNAMVGDAFVLRACIVNHRTARADLSRVIEGVRRCAARV